MVISGAYNLDREVATNINISYRTPKNSRKKKLAHLLETPTRDTINLAQTSNLHLTKNPSSLLHIRIIIEELDKVSLLKHLVNKKAIDSIKTHRLIKTEL